MLCADNEKDVNDIPAAYLKGMEVRYVRTMAEVLDFAVLAEKVKTPKVLTEA